MVPFHILEQINMGQQPKYKIEKLKKEKRLAKSNKKRKVNTRDKFVSFLIVCEGKLTEPNYFEALKKECNSRICKIKILGEGISTTNLIRKVVKFLEMSEQKYDEIWAVFDEDNNSDFNNAIKLAKENNISCAWSNESFELWYYLHFQNLESAIKRKQYIAMIEREIQKKSPNKNYRYKKNDMTFYYILQKYGNESLAIQRAKNLQKKYKNTNYSKHKPCTYVNELVEKLNKNRKK